VFNLPLRNEPVQLFEFENHFGVRLKDRHPIEIVHIDKSSVIVHGGVDLQIVGEAHLIVLSSVSRRRMHTARSGFEGDVAALNDQGLAIVDRMPAMCALQRLRADWPQDLVIGNPESLHASLRKSGGHDVDLVSAHIDGFILKVWMKGHCQVGRNGPRGRCPDNQGNLFPRQERIGVAHISQ